MKKTKQTKKKESVVIPDSSILLDTQYYEYIFCIVKNRM